MKTKFLSLHAILLCCSIQLFGQNHFTSKATDLTLRSDTIDVLHTDLFLDFTLWSEQILQASASINLEVLIDGVDSFVFDLEAFTVDSVLLNGLTAGWEHNPPLLVITPITPANTGETYEVEIYYHGEPQEDASGLGGFYWQNDFAYNIGVGIDADPHSFGRAWFPCFDNFVERSTYTLNVLTNGARTVYCGGMPEPPIEVGQDSLLSVWNIQETLPSYLLSVSVGNYVRSEFTFEGLERDIPVWIAAQPQDTTAALSSFSTLLSCLQGYEYYYGPYAWERVGYVLVPFSSGAMEHAMNIAYPALAANGTQTFAWVMAHEAAHSWWGNLLTCASQEDMWINEGFATYSEALYYEYLEGEDAYSDYMRAKHKEVLTRAHVRDGDWLALSPIAHEVTYGAHAYDKGAVVVYNLRGTMTDDFFPALQGILQDRAFSSISSVELRDDLSGYTDADLNSFFEQWVFQPGFPDFRIGSITTTQSSNGYLVTVAIDQHLFNAPEYFNEVPLQLSFIGSDSGEEIFTMNVAANGAQTIIETELPEVPHHVVINRNEAIYQSVLAEEKMVSSNGTNNFSNAEFRFTFSEIPEGDSLWMRVENHWSSADDPHGQVEFALSTDRFWRIRSSDNSTFNASCRIRYYGNPSSNNFYDTEFFNQMALEGLPEDSLILVYRPQPDSPWELHEDFTVNPQGSSTDYDGRIDFAFIGDGDYGWAYQTGLTSVAERLPEREATLYPNPTSEFIQTNLTGGYEIKAMSGQVVLNGITAGLPINVSTLPTGVYLIWFENSTSLKFIKQ